MKNKRRKYQQGGSPYNFGPFSVDGPLKFGPFQISGDPGMYPDPNAVSQMPAMQQLLNNQDIASQIRNLADIRFAANYNAPDLSGVNKQGFFGFKKGGTVNLNPQAMRNLLGGKMNEGGIPVNPAGLHQEDGPVVIPSRELTFKDIDMPTAVIPIKGRNAVLEIPMKGLLEQSRLQQVINQLDPNNTPPILSLIHI